jgi:hypothetical protein
LGQIILMSMKRVGPSIHDLEARNFDLPKRTAGAAHKIEVAFYEEHLVPAGACVQWLTRSAFV